MQVADYLVIGGGVAGLSLAARLAHHGKVIVIEAEEAIGFHSSGRSATFSHFGIGNRIVRALTFLSRDFFLEQSDPALAKPSSALFVATEKMLGEMDRLHANMAEFTSSLEQVWPERIGALFPPVRLRADRIVAGILFPDGLRLDSDAMLQSYAREVRRREGQILLGRRISAVNSSGSNWQVETLGGESLSAPVLVNAAGAWADELALLAGVAPLGLKPLRRTIIVVDPPEGADVREWPFVKTVTDDFYILPESGKLMASPVDEVESDPCDAQPDEYDVALAAAKVEQYTELSVKRIVHRWAGLRTFAEDRVPVTGFAADAPGFFWHAGQGGFGLQTAPAMADAAEAVITGASWPERLAELGVRHPDLAPERFSEH